MISLHFDSFQQSIGQQKIPPGLTLALQSLWYDGVGAWDQAHALIDKQTDPVSARVHAYLHRKEGDQWNADYWYRKSGSHRPDISLDEEWELLVRQLLAEKS